MNNSKKSPTDLIYGAGAIGSVLGGFLHKINRDVTFAGRGAHFQAIHEQGLKTTGICGEHHILPEEIQALSDSNKKRFSTILLSIKSKDTEVPARDAAPMLDEDWIMAYLRSIFILFSYSHSKTHKHHNLESFFIYPRLIFKGRRRYGWTD